jgi:glycosyltransferase involved in cell wall biosynthesis
MCSIRGETETSGPVSALSALVSIVVEWDNARLSDLGRARAMYRSLVAQVHRRHASGPRPRAEGVPPNRRPGHEAVPRVSEVLILYDALEIDPAVIEAVTVEPSTFLPPDVHLHVVATPGLGYYQLKNEGAKRATGDILVFLDSDVVPEPDWLDQLLDSFADPDVQIVGGNSYIEAASVYTRAFALFWFFPLRAPDGALEPALWFHANNLACRRAVFDAHPFPDEPRFRGQCSTLARTLRARGIPIHANPCARVAHPAPNGVAHFFWRALWEGHDHVVDERLRALPRPGGFHRSYWRFRANAIRAWRRVWGEAPRVGLSRAAAPVAVSIALAYYSLYLVGEVLTRLDGRIIGRRFVA